MARNKKYADPDRESPWATRIPALVILLAFVFSIVVIARARLEEAPPDAEVVLRIGHWQLEGGVRDGIDKLIAEYRKLHPGVYIVQDAIPESTYATWLTTQLMGGTAPDILEVGMVQYAILIGYLKRYFFPLNQYANQPNPYNKGTELEGVPWSSTFRDGMRSGYYGEMNAQMTVPISQFGQSLFYNKSLLKELTGLDECPRDLRAFLAACEEIKRHKDKDGRPYTPIASSNYHWGMWDQYLCDPVTFGAVRHADFNRDGVVGADEMFVAMKTGALDFDFPPLHAKFDLIDEIVQHFQVGFTGLGRDEAVFLFVQGRAVFISTGTWDVGGLVEQARDLKDKDGNPVQLAVSDFPCPSRDDPEYGEFFEGPVYQMPSTGFPFGITRTCRHPEVALDFLHFLSSKTYNAMLNDHIGWLSSVKDTDPQGLLKEFVPNLQGIYGSMPLNLGGDTLVKWTQLYDLFKVGQIAKEDLLGQFGPYYLARGEEELEEIRRNSRRSQPGDEQMAARYLAEALLASRKNAAPDAADVDAGDVEDAREGIGDPAAELDPETRAANAWDAYRTYSSNTLVSRPLGESALGRMLRTGKSKAPYDFSELARERIRSRYASAADLLGGEN
ncbi:MAG: ABC transporter substrate-binding protein [Kiritimatiellia bacterium]|jgi:ABC-type glycerol-3-phosphate transport system substrate-binding protein